MPQELTNAISDFCEGLTYPFNINTTQFREGTLLIAILMLKHRVRMETVTQNIIEVLLSICPFGGRYIGVFVPKCTFQIKAYAEMMNQMLFQGQISL